MKPTWCYGFAGLLAAFVFFLLLVHSSSSPSSHLDEMNGHPGYKFPDDFLFGVGSSSYQVEGAWNEDGKGASIIDAYINDHPNWTEDGQDGRIACDSYHKYQEDAQLVSSLGADFYRFSISWPRILPNGDPTKINQNGLDYYHKLIDALLAQGVQPAATIFHWDLPQALQDIGGWTNPLIVDYFTEYAKILFENFGDKVKWWMTINEPQLLTIFGYGHGNPNYLIHPPGISQLSGITEYLAVHHLLLSHAKAYHLYERNFKSEQGGKIGIVANIFSNKPLTNHTDDENAAKRMLDFEGGWILEPILGPSGDYPAVMRERIDRNSRIEGRKTSRLPVFTKEERALLKGSLDFVGLNYYTERLVENGESGLNPSYTRDLGVLDKIDPTVQFVPGAPWLAHEPKGLRKVLNWIRTKYNNPPVFITENGCDDPEGMNDNIRIKYHREHFKEILNAMRDGCNVIGYTVWSLMDSFEWSSGYTTKFGIFHVDFLHPSRTRTPKKSFDFFQEVFKTKALGHFANGN